MDRKKSQPATIDEYISGCSPEAQPILRKLRAVIKKAAPEATEKISYRMPAFQLNGILVWFGAHKTHIGFYPTGAGVEAFKEELSAYKKSKGSVQFPLDKPLPYALIRKIVKYRVAQNRGK